MVFVGLSSVPIRQISTLQAERSCHWQGPLWHIFSLKSPFGSGADHFWTLWGPYAPALLVLITSTVPEGRMCMCRAFGSVIKCKQGPTEKAVTDVRATRKTYQAVCLMWREGILLPLLSIQNQSHMWLQPKALLQQETLCACKTSLWVYDIQIGLCYPTDLSDQLEEKIGKHVSPLPCNISLTCLCFFSCEIAKFRA